MGAGASSGLRADKATADELFKKADKDQNGVLSLDELCEAASAHGEETKKAWGRERIMDTIQKYDRDGDNQLDPSEWSQAFIELTKAPSADEEMSSSVWEYQGTARHAKNNGLFGDYTIRRALFNPEAHPATTSTGAITLDCEYCAASQGSVGGYRERFDLRWNTKTGELGWKGASWKGYLVDGPGSKLDLKNKWGNLIVLEPVCQLPDSAVMDEDNDPQEEDIEPLAAEQRVMGEAVDAARWPVVLDFLEKPVLPVKVRNEMTEGEVSKAQVEAGVWLVKALDAAPSREGLPALVKRLLSVYRFANQMPMDAFRPLVQLASERLDILGKPLNELYATQDLKGQLGGLGGAALGAKVRQHDIVPTPKTRGFFYPESSQTYDTASQTELSYIYLLALAGRGIDAQFHALAEQACRAAAPNAPYCRAPCKTFPRMFNKLWFDHRDVGAPRPSKNVDVVRSFCSLDTPDELKAVYDALDKAFGGVKLCKNGFADADASESSHYRAVYAIVEFGATGTNGGPLTYGEMAHAQEKAWQDFRDKKDRLEHASIDRAILWMRDGPLKAAPVRMYCEVQLLLEDYRKVRDAMHLFYNVKRCATTGALWRQMAGRVQPKDFAYKSG